MAALPALTRLLEKYGKRGCRRVSFLHCSDWPSRRWQSTIGSLIIIFGLYGYRRMEREALESILKQILRGTIIYR